MSGADVRSRRSIASRRTAIKWRAFTRVPNHPSTLLGANARAMIPRARVADALVVDASAALALLRAEPDGERIRDLLRDALERGAELHVPEHFWLEVVNVLVRRYGQTSAEVVEAVRDLDDLGLQTAEIDRPLLLLSLD